MKRMMAAAAALLGILAGGAVPAAAAHWTVDAAKSKLGFTLPWGKQPFVASFSNWQADIDFEPADLAHAHVVANIRMGTEGSGDDDTDDALKSDQGFGVEKFPTAQFEGKRFQHLTGNDYAADGTLTIRGITKPVHMPFTLVIAGDQAHMVGNAQVKWADYGLGQELGKQLPDLGQIVSIHVDLTAKKS